MSSKPTQKKRPRQVANPSSSEDTLRLQDSSLHSLQNTFENQMEVYQKFLTAAMYDAARRKQ